METNESVGRQRIQLRPDCEKQFALTIALLFKWYKSDVSVTTEYQEYQDTYDT